MPGAQMHTWASCTRSRNSQCKFATPHQSHPPFHHVLFSLPRAAGHCSFGYISNTSVKFLLLATISDSTVHDYIASQLLRQMHHAYINLVSNPFWVDETRSLESMGSGSITSVRSAGKDGRVKGKVGMDRFVKAIEELCSKAATLGTSRT